jgi:DNA-binding beta-propeller fold protein YncE
MNVYVASRASDAVAVFRRNSDGTLAQLFGEGGCISDQVTRRARHGCAPGQALDGAAALAFSPRPSTRGRELDPRHLYVAARRSDGVAILSRRSSDGTLAQARARAGGGLSPDGCITQVPRGTCKVAGRGLNGPASLAFSPDGENLYVAAYASYAVTTLSRERRTGKLVFRGCISETRERGKCEPGRALWYAHRVAVSPDGMNVYVAARDSSAVAIFSRQNARPGTGAGRDEALGTISQARRPDGTFSSRSCISWRGEQWGSGRKPGWCLPSPALRRPYSVAVTSDGAHVIVTAQKTSTLTLLSRQR